MAFAWGATPVLAATTPDPIAASPAEIAAIKKSLEQKFPGVTVGAISKSPYFGLFEVQFDNQMIYTDVKAKYILVGSVYDADTKTNLTEARMRKLNRVDMAQPADGPGVQARQGQRRAQAHRLFRRRLPVLRQAREAN